MNEPNKCAFCTVAQASADRNRDKAEALHLILHHTKESLVDSIRLRSSVDALSLFNFIEKRLTDLDVKQ